MIIIILTSLIMTIFISFNIQGVYIYLLWFADGILVGVYSIIKIGNYTVSYYKNRAKSLQEELDKTLRRDFYDTHYGVSTGSRE